MTDNENDGFSADIDIQDEAEAAPAGRPSLKEIWQNNPLLKIAGAAIGATVLVSGYLTLTAPDPVEQSQSVVRGPETHSVSTAPGQEALDKAYVEALEESNKQGAQQAASMGGSFVSTPVDTSKDQGLNIPQMKGADKNDPLREWRESVKARQMDVSNEALSGDVLAPQPDVVPMVQPIRPQPVAKMDPKMAGEMANQMRTILASQAPPKFGKVSVTQVESAYTKKIEEEKSQAKIGAKTASRPGASGVRSFGGGAAEEVVAAKGKVIVPAGQIAYAQLLTELNSDVPSPVLAVVMSGPFRGARALGEMGAEEEHIVITFSRFVKDGVSYGIDGIALDEATTLPAHQTDIDQHYFTRIVLPAAATFVEGFASSVAETGTATTTTAGGGVATEQPEPETKESLYKGMEEAAGVVADVLKEGASRKPTIKVARGTTMGILFLESIRTTDVEE